MDEPRDAPRCIAELLAACPAFRPHWEEHCAWWRGEAGLMLDLAVFSEYAAQAIERGEAAELAAIGAAAEALLGDETPAGDAGPAYPRGLGPWRACTVGDLRTT